MTMAETAAPAAMERVRALLAAKPDGVIEAVAREAGVSTLTVLEQAPASERVLIGPERFEALWQELKKLVQNPSLAVLWSRAASAELSGDTLIVGFAQKSLAEAFSKQEDMLLALLEQLRPGTRLHFVAAGAKDSLEERAKNAFGGNIEIVD